MQIRCFHYRSPSTIRERRATQRRESESKRAVETLQSSRERAFLPAASSPTSRSSLCRDRRFRFDTIIRVPLIYPQTFSNFYFSVSDQRQTFQSNFPFNLILSQFMIYSLFFYSSLSNFITTFVSSVYTVATKGIATYLYFPTKRFLSVSTSHFYSIGSWQSCESIAK